MPSGIIMTDGFFVAAKKPADMKSIADTIEARDAYVTDNVAYEGMLVYVSEDGKTYQYTKDTTWKEFGFNVEDFQRQVYDGLDSDSTTFALSARQGKVLNTNLTTHINDNIKHITAQERTTWNAKADNTVATQTSNGLMSSTDKINLDNLMTKMAAMEKQQSEMLAKLKTAVFVDDE